MSVGGVVIETVVLDDRVWICTRDVLYGDEVAIYVERTPEARSVSEGDTIWWQGPWALWTPRLGPCGFKPFIDKKLRRIGYSGVPHPLDIDAPNPAPGVGGTREKEE